MHQWQYPGKKKGKTEIDSTLARNCLYLVDEDKYLWDIKIVDFQDSTVISRL